MTESQTKTICFFNSNKAWGGGEKWHLNTAIEFAKRGFKTMIATNRVSVIGEKGIAAGVEVHRFSVGNLSFLNPITMMKLVKFFKDHRVDAVILNLPSDLKAAGIAAKMAGVKKIIYRRGMPHPLRNTALNRYLFKDVLTHVVINSLEIGRTLKQGNESWFPEEKMVLVYNGVDTSRVIDRERKLLEKLPGKLMIGTAGRLTDQKGHIYLVEMAKILKEQGEQFIVYIAGEGELRGFLEEKIREFGVEKEVKLLGHVDDVEGFINSLDVFVFPSKFEGSANTLIEVLQIGKPIVAWDVSSNPEIIVNKASGFLVKLYDLHELSVNILRAKDFKPSTILIRDKFDYSNNITKITNLIME